MIAQGQNGTLELKGNSLVHNLKQAPHFPYLSTEIPLREISSISMLPSGMFVMGYIIFHTRGGQFKLYFKRKHEQGIMWVKSEVERRIR